MGMGFLRLKARHLLKDVKELRFSLLEGLSPVKVGMLLSDIIRNAEDLHASMSNEQPMQPRQPVDHQAMIDRAMETVWAPVTHLPSVRKAMKSLLRDAGVIKS
ncbi:MAG: hypothetical protein ACYTE8_00975 [Planctomycetota bacterium]|jgi:hypothetical protein